MSDGALDTGEISKSGKIESYHNITPFNNKIYSQYNALPAEKHSTYGDSGDQSRYFDLDAWAKHHGILDVPKSSKKERGINNNHPTVKPIKLMSYLIELGCPKDGVVLDPFMGSGTTCVAAKQLGRNFIGIELDEGYYKIAVDRVSKTPHPFK